MRESGHTCCVVGDCNAAIPIQPIGAKNNVVDAHVGLVPGVELLPNREPACPYTQLSLASESLRRQSYCVLCTIPHACKCGQQERLPDD